MGTEGPTQFTHTQEAAAHHLPGKPLFLTELTHSLSHLYAQKISMEILFLLLHILLFWELVNKIE